MIHNTYQITNSWVFASRITGSKFLPKQSKLPKLAQSQLINVVTKILQQLLPTSGFRFRHCILFIDVALLLMTWVLNSSLWMYYLDDKLMYRSKEVIYNSCSIPFIHIIFYNLLSMNTLSVAVFRLRKWHPLLGSIHKLRWHAWRWGS